MIWLQIYAAGFVVVFIGTLIWGFFEDEDEDGDVDIVSFLMAFTFGLFWWLVIISYPIRKYNERFNDYL